MVNSSFKELCKQAQQSRALSKSAADCSTTAPQGAQWHHHRHESYHAKQNAGETSRNGMAGGPSTSERTWSTIHARRAPSAASDHAVKSSMDTWAKRRNPVPSASAHESPATVAPEYPAHDGAAPGPDCAGGQRWWEAELQKQQKMWDKLRPSPPSPGMIGYSSVLVDLSISIVPSMAMSCL